MGGKRRVVVNTRGLFIRHGHTRRVCRGPDRSGLHAVGGGVHFLLGLVVPHLLVEVGLLALQHVAATRADLHPERTWEDKWEDVEDTGEGRR